MSKIKFQRKFLAIPYGIFLVLFVIVPMVLIVVYAFSNTDPVTNKTTFSFDNLTTFFSNSYNLHTFLISLAIGLGNTIICLLIGIMLNHQQQFHQEKQPECPMYS